MIVDLPTGTKTGTIFTPEHELFLRVGNDLLRAPEYLAGDGESPKPGDLLKLLVTTPPERAYGFKGIEMRPGRVVVEGLFQVEEIVGVNQNSLENEENPFRKLPDRVVNGGTHFGLVLSEVVDQKPPKGLRTEKAKPVPEA